MEEGKGQLQVWRDAKKVFESASLFDLHQVWDSVNKLEDLPAARQPRLR